MLDKIKALIAPTVIDDAILQIYIDDAAAEVCLYLNASTLPPAAESIVRDIVITRVNRRGDEGLSSLGIASGGSQTYIDGLPADVKKRLNRLRRLPKADDDEY